MCGIAGLIGRIDEQSSRSANDMNDALFHRGPDGEGFWDPRRMTRAGARCWRIADCRSSICQTPQLSRWSIRPSGDVIVLNGRDLQLCRSAETSDFRRTEFSIDGRYRSDAARAER